MISEIRLIAPDRYFHVAYDVAKKFIYLPTDQSEIFVPLPHYPKVWAKAAVRAGVLTVTVLERAAK